MAEYVLSHHLEGDGKRLAVMSLFMFGHLATDPRHLPPSGARFRASIRGKGRGAQDAHAASYLSCDLLRIR
jgi:hypothetical protein